MIKKYAAMRLTGGPNAPASLFVPSLATFVFARKSLAVMSMMLAGAMATWTPAEARPIHPICIKVYNTCLDSCKKWTSPDLRNACIARCGETRRRCAIWTDGAPKNAQTDPGKNPPKGTGGQTTPTGGTKADPKKPPKVNDTRPPMGGGVIHPKTSGTGTSGPILLKSSGSGPSFRSVGRN